ncbi:hypothetical protein WJX81_001643 [Elliptochloris bilobata]|uniref:cellulase n=1 Tax=Elliptochloris bilobata TaxID=381761 RepID=A0AAW1QNK8_9CHLO
MADSLFGDSALGALAALLGTAGGVSMSQPSTASIQDASSNKTVLAAGAEDAFVGNYTASAADIAACLPLSIKFYDAQRSGRVPSADAHVAWRKDSGLYDEVQGGFYDAGDYVKFNWPQAWSISMLSWVALMYPAGLKATGSYDALMSNIRWGADFLLASAALAPASLVAAVGDADKDHQFWDVAPLQVDILTRTSRTAINVHLRGPGGLFWQTDISPWFSNRAGLSAGLTSLMYIDMFSPDASTAKFLSTFAQSQLDYVLGNNPNYVSYVPACGVPDHASALHHRYSTNFPNNPPTNGIVLEGAMVGGPNFEQFSLPTPSWDPGHCSWATAPIPPANQAPSDNWSNARCEYQRNEVSLDANAMLIVMYPNNTQAGYVDAGNGQAWGWDSFSVSAGTAQGSIMQALASGAKTSTLGAILASSGQSLAPSKVALNGVPCVPLIVVPARH